MGDQEGETYTKLLKGDGSNKNDCTSLLKKAGANESAVEKALDMLGIQPGSLKLSLKVDYNAACDDCEWYVGGVGDITVQRKQKGTGAVTEFSESELHAHIEVLVLKRLKASHVCVDVRLDVHGGPISAVNDGPLLESFKGDSNASNNDENSMKNAGVGSLTISVDESENVTVVADCHIVGPLSVPKVRNVSLSDLKGIIEMRYTDGKFSLKRLEANAQLKAGDAMLPAKIAFYQKRTVTAKKKKKEDGGYVKIPSSQSEARAPLNLLTERLKAVKAIKGEEDEVEPKGAGDAAPKNDAKEAAGDNADDLEEENVFIVDIGGDYAVDAPYIALGALVHATSQSGSADVKDSKLSAVTSFCSDASVRVNRLFLKIVNYSSIRVFALSADAKVEFKAVSKTESEGVAAIQGLTVEGRLRLLHTGKNTFLYLKGEATRGETMRGSAQLWLKDASVLRALLDISVTAPKKNDSEKKDGEEKESATK